jgi:mannose-6-phosphate isomerase-like protein (cupin superfamily)
MNFFHGDKEFIIGEGDCLYYDAGIPHAGVSLGNRNARCLVVICSPDKLGSR